MTQEQKRFYTEAETGRSPDAPSVQACECEHLRHFNTLSAHPYGAHREVRRATVGGGCPQTLNLCRECREVCHA